MPENTASRSQWYVWGLTIVALLLGWSLRTAALTSTRPVEVDGLHVDVPSQWVVQRSSGGGLTGAANPHLALTAWDPLNPGTQYAVRLLPAAADASLATLAAFHNLQHAQSETAFRVLDQTPVTLDGRDGYRVRFAYVDASQMGQAPVVFEGVDYYFLQNGQALVMTMVTEHGYDEALPAFKEFAATAHFGDAP